MRTALLLLFLLACCIRPLFSQDRRKPPVSGTEQGLPQANAATQPATTYGVHYLGLREGLTDRSVHTICHDRDGFVWIGSRSGLLRYDGFEMLPVPMPEPIGKKTCSVDVLHEDPTGRLWAATEKGLVLFPRDRRRAVFVSEIYFRSIVQSGENLLLCDLKKVFRLQPSHDDAQPPRIEQVNFPANIGQAKNQLGCLFTAPDGTIFLSGDPTGALQIRGDSVLRRCPGLHWDSKIQQIKMEDNLFLLYRENKAQVFRFDAQRGRFEALPENNNSLIAQLQKRIAQFAQTHPEEVSPQTAWVYHSWAPDPNGRIWVATMVGIFVLIPEKKQFEHIPEMRGHSMRAIFQDAENMYWGAESMHCVARKTGKLLCDLPALLHIRSILPLDERRLLMTGEYGGYFIFDKKTNTAQAFGPELPPDCFATLRLKNGDIWQIRSNLVFQFFPQDNRTKRLFELPPGAYYDAVEDQTGQVWLAGAQHLVKIQRNAAGAIVQVETKIAASFTGALLRGDSLWLASDGAGLFGYDVKNDRQIAHFTTADGLPNDVLNRLLPDAEGNIWMSTNEGLSRFDPKNRRFVNFSRADGLEMDEYNKSSAWRDPATGRLYFGGLNGVTHFDPAAAQKNFPAPQLLFSKIVRLSEKEDALATFFPKNEPEKDAENEIALAANDRYLEIHLATNDPGNPEPLHFIYQLEGFDKNWVSAGKTNIVRFAQLPAGDYVFRAKAISRNGIFSPERAIRIHVQPVFYKTWWFIALLFGLAGGLFVWFDRQRSLRLKATRDAERAREQNILLEREKELAEAREALNLQELELTRVSLQHSKVDLEQAHKLLELKNALIAQFESNSASRNRQGDEHAVPGESKVDNLRQLKILTDTDWRDFQDRYEQAFPGMIRRLTGHYQGLTGAEIRLLLLLKIGLLSREIAETLGISLESVWKSRHRLKKKMEMPMGDDFDAFVRTFS